jgi:hypothetical protein
MTESQEQVGRAGFDFTARHGMAGSRAYMLAQELCSATTAWRTLAATFVDLTGPVIVHHAGGLLCRCFPSMAGNENVFSGWPAERRRFFGAV